MSEAARPAIGVIVVTRDSEAVLAGLLDSLEAGMEGVAWRAIVVDNGSSDRSIELARSHPAGLAVIETGVNLGFGAAVNRGLAELDEHEHALILNPDTRLAPGAATALAEHLDGGATSAGAAAPVGVVAPRLVDAAGRLAPSLRHEPSIGRALAEAALGVRLAGRLGWAETILDPAAYERRAEADWASGAALLVSREVRAACGPWNESFFLYSEDAEFQLRARDRGFAITLAPEVAVTHLGGESRTAPRLWALLAVNKVVLYRRRHGRLPAALFRAAAVLRELRFAATGNRPSRVAARALLSNRRPSP